MPVARRPKWGQHFLKDQSVCARIAGSLRLNPDELVVEIGAGRGALTRLLAEQGRRLVAVEIDPELAAKLTQEFSGIPQVEVFCADILKMDFSSLVERHNTNSCCVVGNLPYYITSPILHHLLNAHESIRSMTLLMQREVAERVTARAGSRAYGYLSVLAQINAEPHILLTVPPGAFSPPPKVFSALVDFPIAPQFPLWTGKTRREFLEFVQICFRQKRKSLLNNLAQNYSRPRARQLLANHGLKVDVRAEQLDIRRLAEVFASMTSDE